MKRAKTTDVAAGTKQDRTYDPVLVSIPSSNTTATVVAVEWRDGAGELHHADLDIAYVEDRTGIEEPSEVSGS